VFKLIIFIIARFSAASCICLRTLFSNTLNVFFLKN